jgi:hypothetical protein
MPDYTYHVYKEVNAVTLHQFYELLYGTFVYTFFSYNEYIIDPVLILHINFHTGCHRHLSLWSKYKNNDYLCECIKF